MLTNYIFHGNPRALQSPEYREEYNKREPPIPPPMAAIDHQEPGDLVHATSTKMASGFSSRALTPGSRRLRSAVSGLT